ncbi:MAG: Asp-tRNA(Asn)/Glu-tRNA(Gln) amidotransferase subunit GatC [bacterium]|nr:Asp-tRNA(Asn)/Glu-tRNA(Gln) amidotransferase subunit GatC [bacterium]
MIDVTKIAKLSNLPVGDYQVALEDTLKHIGNLKEINTDNVEGTYQVTGKTNATREDKVTLENCVPKKVYATKQIITN